mgnify:FL=1
MKKPVVPGVRLGCVLAAASAMFGCASTRIAVHDLSDECSRLGSVPAIPAEVEFINQSAETRALIWIPSGSDRSVPYADIPAGSSRRQESFVGHFWVLQGAGGVKSTHCVGAPSESHVSR